MTSRLTFFSSIICIVLWIALLASSCHGSKHKSVATSFTIPYPSEHYETSLDGRLILLIGSDSTAEPRFQLVDGPNSCQAFGMDIEDWAPGTEIRFDLTTLGYPIKNIIDIPKGTQWVQILFHKYEIFNRGDGNVVKMPMDRGEGQQWNRAPGNLYSSPQYIMIDVAKRATHSVVLNNKIPPIAAPEDTDYVKHVKIKSELLTKFWGRDMYLGANVLLPEGWEDHPGVRYPLAIHHGHFPRDFGGWRTSPPDADLEPDYSERFKVSGYNKMVQQEAYDFYKLWTGPDFPRVIAITVQHANPYYDDSYAVNSENLGPYGDAITYELIPYIEQQYRGIGSGWARFTYGGSTGGWEALAVQVKYPTEYNGCYAACPDPIDFRAFCLTNIYEDENAYYVDGPFQRNKVPGIRDYLGNIKAYLADMNQRELVLGSRSRSGQQWDIWEAVYSPVGSDGYPKRIWDKVTGVIDRDVAHHWRDNYDLAYILNRDWAKDGKDWRGKINIYCGDMDNYYLNNAVYLAEEILESTTDPLLRRHSGLWRPRRTLLEWGS